MTQVDVSPRAPSPVASRYRGTTLDRWAEITVPDAGAFALITLAIGFLAASPEPIAAGASSDYGLVGQLPPVWWLSVACVVAALAVGSRPAVAPRRWPA